MHQLLGEIRGSLRGLHEKVDAQDRRFTTLEVDVRELANTSARLDEKRSAQDAKLTAMSADIADLKDKMSGLFGLKNKALGVAIVLGVIGTTALAMISPLVTWWDAHFGH